MALTAEPLSLCFTTSFLICSVFNQTVSQGKQISALYQGARVGFGMERAEASAQAPPHTPGLLLLLPLSRAMPAADLESFFKK